MAKELEFPIKNHVPAGLRRFIYSQLFITPPYPTQSFSSQTIIVTGANTGLGLEAARHFYRLDCTRLILAVRSLAKGEAAKENIVASVRGRNDAGVIEVWKLDLSSTSSTLAFAEKAKGLERLDVLLENAGIANREWGTSEGVEMMVQVNVLNTFLLALELLPKLQDTGRKFEGSKPHLTIVSSEAHRLTSFKEVNAGDIYERLNDEGAFVGSER
jgi:NAD(P)-dependent dehydrogenase (short-subunit alcohol dehydrogenase family)